MDRSTTTIPRGEAHSQARLDPYKIDGNPYAVPVAAEVSHHATLDAALASTQPSATPLDADLTVGDRMRIALTVPLDADTCSLERFRAFIKTRSDRATLAHYAAIIEAQVDHLFFVDDLEAAEYDAAQRRRERAKFEPPLLPEAVGL
jgi:hypothetical protein